MQPFPFLPTFEIPNVQIPGKGFPEKGSMIPTIHGGVLGNVSRKEFPEKVPRNDSRKDSQKGFPERVPRKGSQKGSMSGTIHIIYK